MLNPNLLNQIVRYEGGEMEEDEVVEFFQGLIDSGLAWRLQGDYGRMAASMIGHGFCLPPARGAIA